MAAPTVFRRGPWGLVVVAGPDARTFLQSIVSQDLDPVPEGGTVASLLLQPQGKLSVAFRATRRRAGSAVGGDPSGDDPSGDDAAAGDEWWCDTEPEVAERLASGLARFRIRVRVEVTDRTAGTAAAAVVGTTAVTVPDGLLALPAAWGDRPGIDVIGPPAAVEAFVAGCGLPVGDAATLEALRIEAGVPRHGLDIDERTIPQEAFLERDAVSFTKGCFIGQELVCRIDSRGHVNRFLRRLESTGPVVPEPGAEVLVDGAVVGAVTSAAAVPGTDRVVALAMVRREVEPPADVTVADPTGPVPARLVG